MVNGTISILGGVERIETLKFESQITLGLGAGLGSPGSSERAWILDGDRVLGMFWGREELAAGRNVRQGWGGDGGYHVGMVWWVGRR